MSTHTHQSQMKTLCSTCSLRELCLPVGLMPNEFEQLDAVIRQSRRLKKGEYLFRAGEPFSSLYAIRTGFFKTTVASQDGRDQVTGFFMSGELIGMDGICSHVHSCDAVALEDSEVCEIPFSSLEQLLGNMPTLLRHFHRMMSQEITREQSVMLLLGNMQATQRFAAFIVNLASRYEARGYSGSNFQLRMSREEIGNYLGLTIESVSRLLSKFKKEGWLRVSNREIEILQPAKLKAITAGTDVCK